MAYKKTYKKKDTSTMTKLIKKVNKISKVVNQTEQKYCDLTPYNAVSLIPNTTAPVFMLLISQGDDSNTREGNQISLKSLDLRFRLQWASTVITDGESTFKYWVVRDTQTISDGTPTVAEILDGNGTLARLNYTTGKSRFQVLASGKKIYNSNSNTIEWDKKINISKSNQTVRYNGVNTGDIQKNGIYILSQGYNATASGQGSAICTLTCYNRLTFTDL